MGITKKTRDGIRRRMKLLGMTHKQLAEAAGLARPTITNILGGNIKNIRISTLENIARGLGCTSSELLDQKEEP